LPAEDVRFYRAIRTDTLLPRSSSGALLKALAGTGPDARLRLQSGALAAETQGPVIVTTDNGRVYMSRWNQDGFFDPPEQISVANGVTRGALLEDFDRDGHLDLITGGTDSGRLT